MCEERTKLGFDVDNLTASVHAIDWVDPVWHEDGPVRRILSELWKLETVGTAAFAAALLGLFSFGLCHNKMNCCDAETALSSLKKEC